MLPPDPLHEGKTRHATTAGRRESEDERPKAARRDCEFMDFTHGPGEPGEKKPTRKDIESNSETLDYARSGRFVGVRLRTDP